ncbi:MAG: hypothetical protein ACKPGB_15755 [Dolichospermum sp.]
MPAKYVPHNTGKCCMYVSHLREVIEAMGGELKITAKFPDVEVTITNFEDLAMETNE